MKKKELLQKIKSIMNPVHSSECQRHPGRAGWNYRTAARRSRLARDQLRAHERGVKALPPTMALAEETGGAGQTCGEAENRSWLCDRGSRWKSRRRFRVAGNGVDVQLENARGVGLKSADRE